MKHHTPVNVPRAAGCGNGQLLLTATALPRVVRQVSAMRGPPATQLTSTAAHADVDDSQLGCAA